MASGDSITRWIDEVKQGNESAAIALWERYFSDLAQVARKKLIRQHDRMADEEDVALSALDSFFKAAKKGRFPDLRDRDGLWRLLSEMTRRKAVDYVRHNQRLRRGGGKVQGETAFADFDSRKGGIEHAAADELTPELANILKEECQGLLEKLDTELQHLALKKLEGYTNEEIAGQLRCSVATVERRLQLIRRKWQRELEP